MMMLTAELAKVSCQQATGLMGRDVSRERAQGKLTNSVKMWLQLAEMQINFAQTAQRGRYNQLGGEISKIYFDRELKEK